LKRKICIITGGRAEFDLLFPLMLAVKKEKNLQLQIIATGMHLSMEFGLTYQEIEKNFTIDKKIEILLSSDTGIGIAKSMGLAQISFAEAYAELKPDIVVLLGDRFEIFSAAATALVSKIPIAHLDGGELTEGAYDDAMRHAITKMSHLHFTCNEVYRNRVIQLGEHPSRVFNRGSTAMDNIKNTKLLSKHEFEKSINFKLNKKNILVTFHPATLDSSKPEKQFKELLLALDLLKDTHIIFTKANADSGGKKINDMIEKYVKNNRIKSSFYSSLGQLRYLSAISHVDAIVGNSSSGITEAPFFKKASVNLGNRQKGRIRVSSIIDCEVKSELILKAINMACSKAFHASITNIATPYGEGNASEQIVKILISYNLKNILQKSFYDN